MRHGFRIADRARQHMATQTKQNEAKRNEQGRDNRLRPTYLQTTVTAWTFVLVMMIKSNTFD